MGFFIKPSSTPFMGDAACCVKGTLWVVVARLGVTEPPGGCGGVGRECVCGAAGPHPKLHLNHHCGVKTAGVGA